MNDNTLSCPIAVGGVGGSGTRVVAGILRSVGMDIGEDLNESLDNLTFTLLFKDRKILTIDETEFSTRWALFRSTYHRDQAPLPAIPADLVDGDRPGTGMVQQGVAWLDARKAYLSQRLREAHNTGKGQGKDIIWGWKEPNTHIVLPKLFPLIPDLKYVHLVRNGLDMALSENQNQLRFWGRYFLNDGQDDPQINPANSLSYWVRAQQRAETIRKDMGTRFHVIRFEDLCERPRQSLEALFEFCGLRVDDEAIKNACEMIRPPDSLNRGRQTDLSQFDPKDLAWLSEYGYPCL